MKKGGTTSISYEEWMSSLDIQDWNVRTFAREIHENVGQILSLAKIRIASLDPQRIAEAKQIVEQSDLLLTKAIRDLRNLTWQLTPAEVIRQGFAEAARLKLERLQREGRCKVDYRIKGIVYKLGGLKELMLFSILDHYLYMACYADKALEMNIHILYQSKNVSIDIAWKVGLGSAYIDTDSDDRQGIFRRAKLIHAEIRTRESPTEKGVHILVKRIAS